MTSKIIPTDAPLPLECLAEEIRDQDKVIQRIRDHVAKHGNTWDVV